MSTIEELKKKIIGRSFFYLPNSEDRDLLLSDFQKSQYPLETYRENQEANEQSDPAIKKYLSFIFYIVTIDIESGNSQQKQTACRAIQKLLNYAHKSQSSFANDLLTLANHAKGPLLSVFRNDAGFIKQALTIDDPVHEFLGIDRSLSQKYRSPFYDRSLDVHIYPCINFPKKVRHDNLIYAPDTRSLKIMQERAAHHPKIVLEILLKEEVSNQQLHWLRHSDIKKSVRNFIVTQLSHKTLNPILHESLDDFKKGTGTLYRYMAIPQGAPTPRENEPLKQDETTTSVKELNKAIKKYPTSMNQYEMVAQKPNRHLLFPDFTNCNGDGLKEAAAPLQSV